MRAKTEPKPIIVKKMVKHPFTPDEIAELNIRFRQAFQSLAATEAEFESVKAVHKGRITEAEAKMATLDATLNAGFDHREKECILTFDVPNKVKRFYLKLADGEAYPIDNKPALTEPMTADDLQQELIAAESAFNARAELTLWDAGDDKGLLIIGKQGDRWFSALRCNVGKVKFEERLDSEQKSFKQRFDAVNTASKRCWAWLNDTQKDAAKGFEAKIAEVVTAEQEKVE